MGHPNGTITFGVPTASADGKYRSKYPLGNWPGDSAAGQGSGVAAAVSAALGSGSGQASVSGQVGSASAFVPSASASGGSTQITGLTFAPNGAANSDIRINWAGANLLSRTSHTVIVKARYFQQAGYYATIWHCSNDGVFHYDKYEYGCHPYPTTGTVDSTGQSTGGTGAAGTTHYYEMAGLGDAPANLFGHDYIASPNNAQGAPLIVSKNVDVIHIRTAEVIGSTLRQTFWPDALNNPSFRIQQDIPLASLNSPAFPLFAIGCSPWTSSNFANAGSGATNVENPYGVLRGFKLFSAPLTFSDALTEAQSGLNTPVTPAGTTACWYMNENPTPSDITDKSGNGRSPAFANGNRPTLFTGVVTAQGAGVVDTASTATATASGGSSSALVHAQLATVTGSGFGTRANYNVDGYTWNGFNHWHYRFTDFRNGLPADGSPQSTYLSQAFLGGFFPGEAFTFVNDCTARGIVILNGGPSQSGKYFHHLSTGFAQGDYMMVQSDFNAGIPAGIGFYTCWKQRGSTGAPGKKFRWWQNGTGSSGFNFHIDTAGVVREESWPYDASAFYTNNLSPTTWQREEVVAVLDPLISDYRTSGARAQYQSTGDFGAYINGVPVPSRVPLPFVRNGDSNRNAYWTWHNAVDTGAYLEYADLFLDFTPQRVEIWNAAGTIREIQFVTGWSDTTIDFAVNKGEHVAGSVNVKVFNASDQVIATFARTIA